VISTFCLKRGVRTSLHYYERGASFIKGGEPLQRITLLTSVFEVLINLNLQLRQLTKRTKRHINSTAANTNLILCGVLMTLYNFSGLVEPRLSLFVQPLLSFDSVCFVFWLCSLQLVRTPCAW